MTLKSSAKLILGSLAACIASGAVFILAMAGIAGCTTGGGCSDDASLMWMSDIGGWGVLVSLAGMLIGAIWHLVATRREKQPRQRRPLP
jgi:hypothetical protein